MKSVLRTVLDMAAISSVLVYIVWALTWNNIVQPALGELEGEFDPVTTDFVVEQIKTTDGGVLVWGSFEIVRAHECEFLAVEWRVLSLQRSTLADVSWKTTTLRFNGRNYFGPWLVTMSEEDLLYHSEAVVIHQCYWIIRWGHSDNGEAYPVTRYAKPWLTKTHLYP